MALAWCQPQVRTRGADGSPVPHASDLPPGAVLSAAAPLGGVAADYDGVERSLGRNGVQVAPIGTPFDDDEDDDLAADLLPGLFDNEPRTVIPPVGAVGSQVDDAFTQQLTDKVWQITCGSALLKQPPRACLAAWTAKRQKVAAGQHPQPHVRQMLGGGGGASIPVYAGGMPAARSSGWASAVMPPAASACSSVMAKANKARRVHAALLAGLNSLRHVDTDTPRFFLPHRPRMTSTAACMVKPWPRCRRLSL